MLWTRSLAELLQILIHDNHSETGENIIWSSQIVSPHYSLEHLRDLNTLGKLIEKVITERLQFTFINNNFIHLSQLGRLKFKSSMDAGVALTHIIHSGWAKGKTTSTLVFDISQFFPSLNHHLLTLILVKAGLEPEVSSFFANYLVKRKMNYVLNSLWILKLMWE